MTGFGKDQKGQILWDREVGKGLTTLAADTGLALGSNYADALLQAFRMIKLTGAIYWQDIQNADDGPIVFVLADSGLTLAQVEEAIESNTLGRIQGINAEKAHRPVFYLGTLAGGQAGEGRVLEIEKTIRWTFPETGGWDVYAYNLGGAALNTGSKCGYLFKIYGVWV